MMHIRVEKSGERAFSVLVSKLVTTVGMGNGCDIILGPSERPVRIGMFIRKDGGYSFKPLPSGKGITLKGRNLARMVEIRPGDALEYEGCRFLLEDGDASEAGTRKAASETGNETGKARTRDDEPHSRLGRAAALQAYGQPASAAKKSQKSSGPDESVPDLGGPADGPDPKPMRVSMELGIRLHCEILRRVEDMLSAASGDGESILREAESRLDAVLDSFRESGSRPAGSPERTRLKESLSGELRGFGTLSQFLSENGNLEVNVEAWDRVLVRRKRGVEAASGLFADARHLELFHSLLRRTVRPLPGLKPGVTHGVLAGALVRMVASPPSFPGPMIQVRKPVPRDLGLHDLELDHTISGEMREYLKLAVRMRRNILVCGGAGSGKSTLVSALMEGLWDEERIAVMEKWPAIRHPGACGTLLFDPEASGPQAPGEFCRMLSEALAFRPERLILDDASPENLAHALPLLPAGRPAAVFALEAGGAAEALALAEAALQERLRKPRGAGRISLASSIAVVVLTSSQDGMGHKVRMIAETGDSADGGTALREIFSLRGEDGGGFVRGKEPSSMVREARESGLELPFQAYREIEA